MKYIRTKDGEIIEYNYEVLSFFAKKSGMTFEEYIEDLFKVTPDNIVKQADTIEELCDEFVVKVGTGYLITYYNKKLLTQDAIKNGADVYGAIWTNKGLIYVAKMNEKGTLELL